MTLFDIDLLVTVEYWLFVAMVMWFAASMLVAILTWVDDGSGTLFPSPFARITLRNADWKHVWTWHGLITHLANEWNSAEGASHGEDDDEKRAVGAIMLVNVGPFAIMAVLALLWWFIPHVSLAFGIPYGARCVVRARRIRKEESTAATK